MLAEITIAQISDSHLFADKQARHCHANVYQNLVDVLSDIKQKSVADIIVFTGDLTQDHSRQSYMNFAQAVEQVDIAIPLYYLAGNHDEPELLTQSLSKAPFRKEKIIALASWQVFLLSTKSDTPAGKVCPHQLDDFSQQVDLKKSQLVFMHHHPKSVGYFIDRHGLLNKNDFYLFLESNAGIKGVACGHVHQALTMPISLKERDIPLFTCPATSIQFDPNSPTIRSNGQSAGYRLFTLSSEQQLKSEAIFL